MFYRKEVRAFYFLSARCCGGKLFFFFCFSSFTSLLLPIWLGWLAEWRWKLGHWGFVAQTTTDCSLIQQLQDIKSSPSYRFVLSHLREYKHLYWVKLMFWPVKKVMVRNYAFLAPINVCFCSPFLLYGELCNLHVTRVSNWQILLSLIRWTLYLVLFWTIAHGCTLCLLLLY